jgi:hypothetical protein
MSLNIEKFITTKYRVRCTAQWMASPTGCSGLGPVGDTPEDAIEAAIEAGWDIDEQAVCPAHVETIDQPRN